MRRQNPNLSEEVVLFLGECDLIILNSHHQIALATRTLLMKEDVLLTYQNPNAMKDPKAIRPRQQSISLQRLTTHQHEYRIVASMRARLLLGRRDDGVLAYLKELKVQCHDKEASIVAVISQQDNVINGFVFGREAVALDFYESLNTAIATQMYLQKLPESLLFNPKLVNLLAETLNGRCSISPQDFCDGKQQEEEVRFGLDFLKGVQNEALLNFRGLLCEMQLKFRIIDDTSRDYADSFLGVFPEKVERLILAGCELNSNMVAQLLSGAPPGHLPDRLTRLIELDLSRNALNDDVFTTLTKLLKGCKRLQTLQLGNNGISFQKEAIIVGFLSAITNCRLSLLLPSNTVRSARHIIKYLVNAQGPLPLSDLDLSFNPIVPEELGMLTKAYLLRLKTPDFDFRLRLNQLEFQEPHAFEFLQEEYRSRKPNTMAIPVALSRHVLRRKGKEVGNTEEELDRSNRIEQLFRNYAVEVYRGCFFRLRQIRGELMALGVDEEAIDAQVVKLAPQKQLQQQMILRRVQACLNMEVQPPKIISYINETLRFCRRKGLQGIAFDLLACVKARIEQLLDDEAKEGNLGRTYRQVLHLRTGRFKAYYQRSFREDYVFNINLPNLLTLTQQELARQQKETEQSDNTASFLTFHYLMAEQGQKLHLFVLETCLADPRLTSLKIARYQGDNLIRILEKRRIQKAFLPIPEDRTVLLSSSSIETYNFSQSFIQSGVSSSAFTGMLSRAVVQAEQEKVVLAFVQISKNFLKYLYYTPAELSDQTLMYLSSITTHLSSLQNEGEDALKLVLAEELFLHFITFYDQTRYQPLKPGLLTAVCEFICRRVALGESLLKRVATFVLKTEGRATDLKIHHSPSGEPWEGKVDWKVGEVETLRNLVLSRGKIQVMVGDIAHPQLLVPFQVDQLDTVLSLWQQVRQQVDRLNEFTNLSQGNIDCYWLCAAKGEIQHSTPSLLLSHQHIGKLIYQEGYATKFYLRRVLYRPQEHSLEYLRRAKYEQLVAIYEQARESIRLAATLFLSPQATLQSIILTIWTDILLADELQLGDLRKESDEESQTRYRLEREKIVNDCISRLYSTYVPIGFSLDEAARNRVIFETKSRQQAAVPANITPTVKESIISLLKATGIAAYTIALPAPALKFILYLNNHHIVFVDRSQAEPKIVQANMRNVVGFQLTEDQGFPLLRFEVMEQGEGKCDKMGLHRFTIQGDNLWIAQCFALITQVARNRLSYPPELLFTNEDESTCFSECPVKDGPSLLSFPLLNLDPLLACTLPRRQEPPSIAVVPPPPPQNSPSLPPKPQRQREEILPDENNNNSLAVASRPQTPIEKGASIEEIIKSVEEEQEVVTSRRSSNLRKDVPRRRSRNR